MKSKKSKVKGFLIGIVLMIFVVITIKPFYHWCEDLYADACQIMKILQSRADEYSWMDTQIEEDDSAKQQEATPKYINRYNPN